MPQKPPTFKTSLVFKNRIMAYFYNQLEQQHRILQKIQTVLPEALAKQTRHCLLRERKLIIYTDSAAWATQLRFYNSAMTDAVMTLTKTPIESLKIKIITGQTGLVSSITRKAKLPSIEKIKTIRSDSLTIEDNQLRFSLQKLSTTLERLSCNIK
jgi:hypothetical protein